MSAWAKAAKYRSMAPNAPAKTAVANRVDVETGSVAGSDCVASMTTSVLLRPVVKTAIAVRIHGRSPGSWRFFRRHRLPGYFQWRSHLREIGAAPFYSRGVGCDVDALIGSARHIPFSSRFALGIAGTMYLQQ